RIDFVQILGRFSVCLLTTNSDHIGPIAHSTSHAYPQGIVLERLRYVPFLAQCAHDGANNASFIMGSVPLLSDDFFETERATRIIANTVKLGVAVRLWQ